jgi:hypothetical protein
MLKKDNGTDNLLLSDRYMAAFGNYSLVLGSAANNDKIYKGRSSGSSIAQV